MGQYSGIDIFECENFLSESVDLVVFGEDLLIFVLQLELVLFSLFIYYIFNVLELFLCGQRCMLEFSLKSFELEIFRVKLEISILELSLDPGKISTAVMNTHR